MEYALIATLISMERACLLSNDKQFVANAIRMYSVTLAGGDARKLVGFDLAEQGQGGEKALDFDRRGGHKGVLKSRDFVL